MSLFNIALASVLLLFCAFLVALGAVVVSWIFRENKGLVKAYEELGYFAVDAMSDLPIETRAMHALADVAMAAKCPDRRNGILALLRIATGPYKNSELALVVLKEKIPAKDLRSAVLERIDVYRGPQGFVASAAEGSGKGNAKKLVLFTKGSRTIDFLCADVTIRESAALEEILRPRTRKGSLETAK
ncbi:MAG: hypothetical protein WCT28_04415 [Patescibacteria group bacterium]|jgi:hypothetical protein